MKDRKYYEQQASYNEWLAWFKDEEHEQYVHPDVTIDLIVCRFNNTLKNIEVLLEKRSIHPFKDQWSLIGSYFKSNDKDIDDTAKQAWHNKVTPTLPIPKRYAEVGTFSKAGRDPRGQVVSLPRLIFVSDDFKITQKQKWTNIYDLVDDNKNLAFDHQDIIISALQKMRMAMHENRSPLLMLGEQFSLNQVIALQSQLFKQPVSFYNRANVRKFILPYVTTYQNKAQRLARYTYNS